MTRRYRACPTPDEPGRFTGDAGQVAGIEAIPFGMLTFVVGSLLIANAWAVVDAKVAVSAASREAVRAYVEAPDQSSAAVRAEIAARDAISGHGRDPERVGVFIEHEDGLSWGRCVRVVATIRYTVPALALPWIGGYGNGFDVRSSHSEVIDPFRADLPAGSRC